jgi:hypothetical protein
VLMARHNKVQNKDKRLDKAHNREGDEKRA